MLVAALTFLTPMGDLLFTCSTETIWKTHMDLSKTLPLSLNFTLSLRTNSSFLQMAE